MSLSMCFDRYELKNSAPTSDRQALHGGDKPSCPSCRHASHGGVILVSTY